MYILKGGIMKNSSFIRCVPGIVMWCTLMAAVFIGESTAQTDVRTEILIPDIPGYLTLKCDFHTHTVFSDGSVWPSIRSAEAWREGLDVFAITDHIEYTPHRADIPVNYNRSYEIARKSADPLAVICIRGAEITRDMPPGHFNAIFLEDINTLNTPDFLSAVKAAADQGAFITMNHPGWTGQQPDGVPKWYPIHTEIYDNKMLHGIEIVNDKDYYPLAHRWCLDKKLTMLGCSDIHGTTTLEFGTETGGHRPITLVFAKEKTPEAVRDALFSRRTAVYWKSTLIGEEKFLRPIFTRSIEVTTTKTVIEGRGSATVQIRNMSDIPFELEYMGGLTEFSVPASITIPAGKTTVMTVKATADTRPGSQTVKLPYRVNNLYIEPEKGMPVELNINVKYVPEKAPTHE